jgi:hypothetical protein
MAVTILGAGEHLQYVYPGSGGGRGTVNIQVLAGYYQNRFTGAVPGDLIIAAVGTSRQPVSYNAGWTQVVNTGAGTSFVSVYTKLFEGDADDDSLILTFAGTSVSSVTSFAHLRSPSGFDAASIKSNQQNYATNAGASYALVGAMGAIASGEVGLMLGGCHSATAYMNNTTGSSGTNWNVLMNGGVLGVEVAGAAAAASSTFMGTPGQPSVTFNLSGQSMNKFIFACVMREATPPPPAGGGLFWGQ